VTEADGEGQERDVDGAEDGRHPRRHPFARVGSGEGRDRDEDEPDPAKEQPAPLEHIGERRIEDDDEREDDAEGRERAVSRRAEEPEDLDRSEGRQGGDDKGDDHATEREGDGQGRDEDRRRDRPLAHARVPVPPGQRPKRRCRRANSRMAPSKASGPKSGQSTSLDTNSA
jgi:hypothetical protein